MTESDRRAYLKEDVEQAMLRYLGLPTFETNSFPDVALAFANVIATSDLTHNCCYSSGAVANNAKDCVVYMGDLIRAIGDVVE